MRPMNFFYRCAMHWLIAPCVLLTFAGCVDDTLPPQAQPPAASPAMTQVPEKPEATPPDNPLRNLPPTVADAWKSAGATQFAWMSLSEWGSVGVIPDSYATADDLPVFVFEQGWLANPQQALPDPGFEYGVAFSESESLPDSLGPFLEYAPLDNCVAVRLWGNVASKSSVEKLDRLTNLHSLAFSEVREPDEFLKSVNQLKQLTRLEVSSVNKSNLTDAGLAELEGLDNIEWLCLTGGRVTDAGMHVIPSLTRLQGLHLYRTDIGIDSIDDLLELKDLKYLDVRGTFIRDEAGQLPQMTQLQKLRLQASFDKQELEKVKEALPDCEIILK